MSDNSVIKVSDVTKTFKLPHEKVSSIKGAVVNFYRRKRSYELQTALKRVSFEVNEGDFFGIVGRNGSGKSTLLKILSGIYSPTKGHVNVKGKLTPFIELGVGFNPELTGRENVFLNGALLGFTRKEMTAMYDDIVEFAELDRFMDQKLKNYSSGMQVRLAFSIAIRAQGDILLLDEVLAVGDEAFQQKCVDIFEEYKKNKRTVVLVTHDMETVRRFCNRAMLVQDGVVTAIGEPNMIASKYSRLNSQKIADDMQEETPKSEIKVSIEGQGKKAKSYQINDTLRVELSWPKKMDDVKNVGIAIIKNSGEYVFGANTLDQPKDVSAHKIRYDVELSLGPGKYYLMAGLFKDTKYEVVDFLDHGPGFIVENDPTETAHGLVRLKHEWKEVHD